MTFVEIKHQGRTNFEGKVFILNKIEAPKPTVLLKYLAKASKAIFHSYIKAPSLNPRSKEWHMHN